MSAMKFLTIYLIAMFPTYIYRWFFVAGAIADASAGGNNASALGSTATILLAISYAAMIYVSHKRGSTNDRKFLVAFPVAGAVFDIFLGFIPFMHLPILTMMEQHHLDADKPLTVQIKQKSLKKCKFVG